MNGIDLLPENDLVTKVKTILDDIEALKQAQRMGGDVVAPTVVESANAFDVTAVLSAGLYQIYGTIEFTADHQLNPYMRPSVLIYDMAGNLRTDVVNNSYGSFATFGPPNGNWDDGKVYNDLNINDPAPFKIKIQLLASDTGSFIYTSGL